jgi:hypothetical protein
MLFILPRQVKKAWNARPTRSGPVRQDIIVCGSDNSFGCGLESPHRARATKLKIQEETIWELQR